MWYQIHTGLQTIPLQRNPAEKIPVTVVSTQVVPGCTIQFFTCKAREFNHFVNSGEGLVEPSDTIGNLPKHLCVARSLATITPDNMVIVQVVNVSPSPIKMYRGMKLGQITPRESILIINQGDVKAHNNNSCVPDFNLDSSILSPSEQAKLLDLLSEYSHIFATQGTPPAQTTVVKHSIKTTGAPIR